MYFTVVVAEGGNVQDATVAFTKALIAKPAGTRRATFRQDGTSTGGLWDKFPTAGDNVLPGLKPVNDMQTGR